MIVALYSPHGTYDAKFLANYEYINLNDPVTRLPGIASVQVFGAGQYAMRMWLKPDALAKLGITVSDVVNAVQAQNTVNPAGQMGGEPAPKGQEFTYSVRAQGRLTTPETVRRHHRARESRWRGRSGEGRGAHRTRRAELHIGGPPERQAKRHSCRLPATWLQCRQRLQRRPER